jgi:hypothetical protein
MDKQISFFLGSDKDEEKKVYNITTLAHQTPETCRWCITCF